MAALRVPTPIQDRFTPAAMQAAPISRKRRTRLSHTAMKRLDDSKIGFRRLREFGDQTANRTT